MKILRKRAIWILVVLFLLPVLVSGVWYSRQVRQQHLDRSLIEAVKKEDTNTAITLLNAGADANATDRPYTPLTFKSLLVDFWNRMKVNNPTEDRYDYSSALLLPYYSGVIVKRDSVTQMLLNRNYGIGTFSGPTKDNPELVQALLEHGANPSVSDGRGRTVLHYAVYNRHAETVKVLLKSHVNPNIKDDEGKTPLWDANIVCARLLIAGGAKVSIRDNKGNTMLQYVAGGVDAEESEKIEENKDLIPLLHQTLKNEQAQH